MHNQTEAASLLIKAGASAARPMIVGDRVAPPRPVAGACSHTVCAQEFTCLSYAESRGKSDMVSLLRPPARASGTPAASRQSSTAAADDSFLVSFSDLVIMQELGKVLAKGSLHAR